MVRQDVDPMDVTRLTTKLQGVWNFPDSFRHIEGDNEPPLIVGSMLQRMLTIAVGFSTQQLYSSTSPTTFNFMSRSYSPQESIAKNLGFSYIYLMGTDVKEDFNASCRQCYIQPVDNNMWKLCFVSEAA